ncbi:MAG: S8 family serine peptidase, partial [Dehalococcoidia bacterium]
APDVELVSIRVLGAMLSGKGPVFAHGLRWGIEQGLDVINLSLGTTKRDYYGLFHELADLAYFRNTVLVTAANNMPVESYPSLYSSVVSVACHDGSDPYEFYYNPSPPVEFGAPGINVTVAWLEGQTATVTGNSFSAPHITGLAAKILSKHPGLTPFQIKTILRATAANARME